MSILLYHNFIVWKFTKCPDIFIFVDFPIFYLSIRNTTNGSKLAQTPSSGPPNAPLHHHRNKKYSESYGDWQLYFTETDISPKYKEDLLLLWKIQVFEQYIKDQSLFCGLDEIRQKLLFALHLQR